jgi:hypothetical protein
LEITLAGSSGSASVQQTLELVRANWQRLGAIVETRYYLPSILFWASPDQGILASGRFDATLFSYGKIRASTLASSFSCPERAPKGSNYSRLCDRLHFDSKS